MISRTGFRKKQKTPKTDTETETPEAEHGLTDEKIAAIKHAFSIYDRGGEGVILTRELGTLMKSLGHDVQKDELVDLMNEVDYEGNGTITIQDFMSLMVNKSKEDAFSDKLIKAFKIFDQRGKGYLDIESMRHVLSLMDDEFTEDEIDDMLKSANKNGDDRIVYEDFIKQLVR